MNKTQLENMIDDAYKLHEEHKEDTLLRDNFNACQMLYHDLFDMWYIPARKVELDLWENALDMPVYHTDCYNHE